MKKLLAILCTGALLTLAAHAADGDTKPAAPDAPKKPALTAEQKALRKEMLEKYDANKDGKFSKEEKKSMTPEEKAKWDAAFPPKPKTEGEHKEGDHDHKDGAHEHKTETK